MIFSITNNKGTDQTVRMCRLVSAFVVFIPPKTVFLASRPIYDQLYLWIVARQINHNRTAEDVMKGLVQTFALFQFNLLFY